MKVSYAEARSAAQHVKDCIIALNENRMTEWGKQPTDRFIIDHAKELYEKSTETDAIMSRFILQMESV